VNCTDRRIIRPMPYLGEAAALATALLWTLSSLAWTSAGKFVGAVQVSFIRLVITCGLLLVYGQLVRGRPLPSDASADAWLVLGLSGFVGFFVTDLCLFKAYLLIGPRLALVILSLSPPVASLLSAALLGDWLSAKDWLAMAVTLAGVAWVVFEQPDTSGRLHYVQPHRYGLGIALAVFAALGHATALVLSKRGIGDYDPFAATFIRVLGSLVGYVPLMTILGRWPGTLRAVRHGRTMLILTGGAFVGPFLGVAMYMIAVRHAQAGVVATILATMPVLILPFVIFLYRERVSLRAAAGAILSVIGVGLLVM
jgi:drug/metabolite transporter (DMT)-like permease